MRKKLMSRSNSKYVALIVSAMLAACSIQSKALEVTYIKQEPFRGTPSPNEGLLLKGKIIPGDYDRLINIVKKNPKRFYASTGLILASPGGDISEALKIAEFVKKTYSPVWVGEWAGPCVSACFLIYASASKREAGTGTIGVHRPYVDPKRLTSLSILESETSQKRLMHAARAYLEEHDVPTNIIDKMFQSSSLEVYWLSRNEIDIQLGRRPPWYEQYLIAHCGYNKEMEARYFETNDEDLGKWLTKVDTCGNELSIEQSRKFLNGIGGKERKH